LDRSDDEIHIATDACASISKSATKSQQWLLAYENINADVGLASGLQGRAQSGKGIWAMPHDMQDMVLAKIAHPQANRYTE
jgi:malate synthase